MRKKLLFLISSSDWGGAQKHLYDLARLLDKEKYAVEVACRTGGPLIEKLQQIGIRVFPVPELHNAINPINDTLAFVRICKIIKRGKYDIVHCHSTKAGILGRIAAKLTGVSAILFTVHGFAFRERMFLPKKILLIIMEKISAACCHRLITVSEYDRKDAVKLRLKKPAEIVTIHNGIDIDSLKNLNPKEREELRGRLGIDEGCTVVGTVANFYRNKGYPYLLHAARSVLEKNASVRFISVGDGPLRKDIQRMVQSLGLNEKFILIGFQTNPLSFLSIMDIFVLSSIKEGLPFSILEAMALGKPVVVTAVGGIPEVVENWKSGILVRPADSTSLAEGIFTLLSDISLRERLAQSGKQRVFDFSLNNMVEKVDNLYDNLLGSTKEIICS